MELDRDTLAEVFRFGDQDFEGQPNIRYLLRIGSASAEAKSKLSETSRNQPLLKLHEFVRLNRTIETSYPHVPQECLDRHGELLQYFAAKLEGQRP